MEKGTWHPGALLTTSGFYWQTCTLHAGVKLDIFTTIGNSRITATEIAARLQADPRATAMLLDALAAMGLLEKTADAFANTHEGLTWLSRDSADYIGYIILHHHNLVASWSKLDEAVRSGRPVRQRANFQDPEIRRNFLLGMFNLAMSTAPRVVPMADLAGRKNLLDLGGGPGTYAIHFCKHNPGLRAAVFDLPTTRPFALETIERFGLGGRIDFVSGDYLTDEIPQGHDVVWLSHILHGEGPGECEALIAKAVAALAPGGLILVHDFILDDTRDRPLFPALFSLNMLLGTEGGQSYTETEITAMLENVGVGSIRRLHVKTPNDSDVLMGVKGG
ncbi:methyltransferase [Desulfococcus sp.]|uniref:methyltransferase n=1 Tax=Desulfococcus sp. TaxID=2025834 RepID=UPI003593AD90